MMHCSSKIKVPATDSTSTVRPVVTAGRVQTNVPGVPLPRHSPRLNMPGQPNPRRRQKAGRDALPELRACFDVRDPLLHVLVAEALWRVSGELRLEVLRGALEAENPPEWWNPRYRPPPRKPAIEEVFRILSDMGPAARAMVPTLEALLANGDVCRTYPEIEETLSTIR